MCGLDCVNVPRPRIRGQLAFRISSLFQLLAVCFYKGYLIACPEAQPSTPALSSCWKPPLPPPLPPAVAGKLQGWKTFLKNTDAQAVPVSVFEQSDRRRPSTNTPDCKTSDNEHYINPMRPGSRTISVKTDVQGYLVASTPLAC